MKKVIVVWRAGPRSSKCPRPIPSSCQRNSFRPLDWRAEFSATAEPAGDIAESATATVAVELDFAGDDGRGGSGGSWPGRGFPKKFILVGVFSACFHGHRLGHGCGTPVGLCSRASVLRAVLADDFHLAVHLRAFSNGNSRGGNIAADFAGRSDLHSLAATQGTGYFSTDDDLTGVDVGGNFAVRADGDAAIGKMNRTLHFPIDIEIVAAAYFHL